jgi:hypothetical protein
MAAHPADGPTEGGTTVLSLESTRQSRSSTVGRRHPPLTPPAECTHPKRSSPDTEPQ